MKPKNKIINLILIIFLTSIFLYMLFLNTHIHKYHDEFVYSFVYGTTSKCENLIDVFTSLKNLYLMHNGRIISTGIMCILLMLPKIFSDILNSLFFVMLIFIIYKYINLNNKKNFQSNIKNTNMKPKISKKEFRNKNTYINQLLNLFLIFPILWCTIPEFNGTITWFSGAVNYLWSTVFMLIYLYIVIKIFIYNNNVKKIKFILLLLFGFIIGSLHEAIGIITTSFLFFIVIYIFINSKKLNYIFLFSSLCSFIGFLTIILSPGNHIRSIATTSGNNINLQITFLNSFIMLKNTFINNYLIFILLIIFLICFIMKHGFIVSLKNKKFIINIFFIFSAILVYVGMIFSPTFAERVTFAPYILFLITFFNILHLINFPNYILYIIQIILLLYFSFFTIPSIYETSNIVQIYYIEWSNRDNYIKEQKLLGKKDIQLEPFSVQLNNKIYGGDISDSLSYNHNGSMAMYYELNSIRIKKNFYIDLNFCNLSQNNNLDIITLSNNTETSSQTISILPEYIFNKQAPYKNKKHSTINGDISLYYGLNNLNNLKLQINSNSEKLYLSSIHIYNYENLDITLSGYKIKNIIKNYDNIQITNNINYIIFSNFNKNSFIDLNLKSLL